MYNKLNLKKGDILTEHNLVHIEDGIVEVNETIQSANNELIKVLETKNLSVEGDNYGAILQAVKSLPAIARTDLECGEWIDIRENQPDGTIRMLVTDFGQCAANFYISTISGDFRVDWGDGTITTHASGTWVSHPYTKGSGAPLDETRTQFVIEISAQNEINRFILGGTVSVQYPIEWFCSKNVNFTNCSGMFSLNDDNRARYIKRIEAVGGVWSSTSWDHTFSMIPCDLTSVVLDTKYANTTFKMFYKSAITKIDQTLDLSNCTNTSYMFYECRKLKTLCDHNDVLDLRNVGDMTYMFYACDHPEMTKLPILKTDKATIMNGVFQGMKNLKTIPELKTDNATNVANLFFQCHELEIIPDVLNTPKATNHYAMFTECKKLPKIPEGVDTSNSLNTGYMFNDCCLITEVPNTISTHNATNVSYMFRRCYALKSIQTENFTFERAIEGRSVFEDCTSLTNLPEEIIFTDLVDRVKTGKAAAAVNSCEYFASGCSKVTTVVKKVVAAGYAIGGMFVNCTRMTFELDRLELYVHAGTVGRIFNNTTITKLPSEIHLFSYLNCSFYNIFDISVLPKVVTTKFICDTVQGGEMKPSFYGCTGLETANIEFEYKGDITLLKNSGSSLFYNCAHLKEIGKPFIIRKDMFHSLASYVSRTKSLYDIGGIDVEEGHKPLGITNCTMASSIREFIPNGVIHASAAGNAFRDCPNLRIVKNIDFSKATNIDLTYYMTPSLVEIDPVIDFSANTYNIQSTFQGTNNLQGEVTFIGIDRVFDFKDKKRITKVIIENPKLLNVYTINLSNNGLTAESINEMFEKLPVTTQGHTINIVSNPGTPECNPTIATSKGWKIQV